MTRVLKSCFLIMLPVLALAVTADSATADACLDCHKSSVFKVKHKLLYDYYVVYEASAHGQAGLSCVDCHGGDPDAMDDKEAAHEGVKAKERAAYAKEACAACHAHESFAFNNSDHCGSSKEEHNAITCVVCHGSMEIDGIRADKVTKRCLECHDDDGPDGVAGRAGAILEEVATVKGLLDFLEDQDPSTATMSRLRGSFDRLTAAWHRFDLETAGQESQALLVATQAEMDALTAE